MTQSVFFSVFFMGSADDVERQLSRFSGHFYCLLFKILIQTRLFFFFFFKILFFPLSPLSASSVVEKRLNVHYASRGKAECSSSVSGG